MSTAVKCTKFEDVRKEICSPVPFVFSEVKVVFV